MNIKILNKFLDYLLCIKNYSKSTIEGYRIDLIMFFNFVISFLDLKIKIQNINVFILGDIEESTILSFLTYLNKFKNNNAKSRARKIASIKAFYKWLFYKYNNILKQRINPTLNLPTIEQQIGLPKYLKLEDAINLENIFSINNSKNHIRNNTIIILFLNCGLRLSELSNININDINVNDRSLRVVGKGNKERIVYLNNTCIKAIKQYLKIRNSNNNAFFINSKKERLKNRAIQNICKKAFKLAGLSDYKYTTHSLRHTAATYMYRSSKDILIVKKFLGHESMTSTQIYMHLDNNLIKKAVDKNPLNNL